MTEHTTPIETMTAYFDSWKRHEFDRFQSLLADDVDFEGPFGTADGPAACRKGIEGMAKMAEEIDVRHMAADGEHVITWFRLKTADAEVNVANLSHVRDGKVVRVRAAFDPRPLLST